MVRGGAERIGLRGGGPLYHQLVQLLDGHVEDQAVAVAVFELWHEGGQVMVAWADDRDRVVVLPDLVGLAALFRMERQRAAPCS